ncbi:MAG: TolC family protein [Bdellovibrionales bacterium]|nr:TolC family protein [Bdellovibrionales bacterium]
MFRMAILLLMPAVVHAANPPANPVSYQFCLESVAISNPELLSAQESLRSQEELVAGSYSAFFPSVNASLGVSNNDPKRTVDPQYLSSIGVSYNLFSGLRDRARVRTARANLEIARAALDSVRAKVSFQLRQAFAQALYARENILLTRAIRERRAQNERLVRAQYESGRENEGSYQFSKSLLEQAEYDERVARDQAVIAAQNLSHVIGFDSTEVMAEGEVPISAPPDEADARKLLLLTPAHRTQSARIELADAQFESARSGFIPSLDLSGSLSYLGTQPTLRENRNLGFGIALTIPLFSGLSTFRDLRSAGALQESAAQTRNAVDFETLSGLRQALFVFQQSIQRLKVDTNLKTAATIRATIARKRYNHGLLMFEQWDIIETDLITRQKNALASKRDRIIAEGSYRQIQGLGDLP